MTGATDTCLLILPDEKKLFAMSPRALQQAQSPRAKLLSAYRGALVLDRTAGARRIERIDVIGPWGEGPLRRLWSRLNDAWNIAVELSPPLDWPMSRLGELVLECLRANGGVLDPEGRPPAAQQEERVRQAQTVGELLDALALPPPEDALDVL